MALSKGTTFATYEDFDKSLKKFEQENGVRFVKKSSRKMDSYHPDMSRLQYRFISFECTNGKKRPSESKGIRPNQGTRKLDCTAKFVITAVQNNGELQLRISSADHKHTHHSVDPMIPTSPQALSESDVVNDYYAIGQEISYAEVTPIIVDIPGQVSIQKTATQAGKKATKRKRATEDKALDYICKKLMVSPQFAALSMISEDEHDAYGKTIAHKMRSLPREQRIHAQKLFGDILYAAEMNNLTSSHFLVQKIVTKHFPNNPTSASELEEEDFVNIKTEASEFEEESSVNIKTELCEQ